MISWHPDTLNLSRNRQLAATQVYVRVKLGLDASGTRLRLLRIIEESGDDARGLVSVAVARTNQLGD